MFADFCLFCFETCTAGGVINKTSISLGLGVGGHVSCFQVLKFLNDSVDPDFSLYLNETSVIKDDT